MGVSGFIEKATLKDEVGKPVSAWYNEDIRPLPPHRRTWTGLTYFSYQSSVGIIIVCWSTGASLLGFGLNAWQAILDVIIGYTCVGLLTMLGSQIGGKWHIGFPVANRFSWGMRANVFPVFNRVVLNCTWFATESWLGSMCVKTTIGALWPSFYDMKNTLPASVPMETNDFVAWFIFCLFVAAGAWVKPEVFHWPSIIVACSTLVTSLAMLGWFVSKAGGSGALFRNTEALAGVAPASGSQFGWMFVRGITTVIASQSTGILGFADWGRYAKYPGAQRWPQGLGMGLADMYTAIVGIICASCCATIYPDAGLVWNPALLLTEVQQREAPAARAAVFFASVPILLSQILITVTGSCVAGGIDMSGLCPKFINLKRGAYIVLCIGILMQPWQLANTSNKFISVMGSYAIFLAPLTGLLHCEYYLVRKQALSLSDLYKPNASSSYWYFHGVNPRTLVSFVIGFSFFLPGFVHSVTPSIVFGENWNRLFYMCYPLGYFGTGIIHYVINYFFPVPELGKVDDVDYFGTFGDSQLPFVDSLTGVAPSGDAYATESQEGDMPKGLNNALSSKHWDDWIADVPQGKIKCVVDDSDICRHCRIHNFSCVRLKSQRGKWSRAAKRSGHVSEPTESTPSTNTQQEIIAPQSASPTSSKSLQPHADAVPPNDVVDVEGALHFKVDNALFPLGVLAQASRQIQDNSDSAIQPESPSDQSSPAAWGSSRMLGVANTAYFREDIRHQLAVDPAAKGAASILTEGIITTAQAHELFDLFFTRLNPQIGLLSKAMNNPQLCNSRSPFLFTAVCAIAARYYQSGILYNSVIQHARRAGMEAMLSSKSTATVQGFILLATWSQPSASYETDNAYLYAGIALRIGIEIGLHRKTVLRYPDNMDLNIKEMYIQELLARERTWMCCFVLDRSMSAQTGKPPQVPETFGVRDVDHWYHQPGCTLSDVFISATAQLLRHLYRCFDVLYSNNDTFTGMSTSLNYQVVVRDLNWRLDGWSQIWERNLRNFSRDHQDQGALDMYLSYLRLLKAFYNLIPLSFGLHHCTIDGYNKVDQISFVTRCYDCAVTAVKVTKEELPASSVFKFTTDQHVVAITYSACFLLKLIGPEFRHLFDEDQVIGLVEDAANLLRDASDDENHIPYLYSIFIRKHLALHRSARMRSAKPTSSSSSSSSSKTPDGVNLMIANPIQDTWANDLNVASDGSINLVSAMGGTETFRPVQEQMSFDWFDSVLGLQNQYQDPLSLQQGFGWPDQLS